MSKETIMEEFANLAPEYGKWRIDRNIAKHFISKVYDLVRLETIKEVEEVLDEYFKGLIMMPNPQATKEKIKSLINKQL